MSRGHICVSWESLSRLIEAIVTITESMRTTVESAAMLLRRLDAQTFFWIAFGVLRGFGGVLLQQGCES